MRTEYNCPVIAGKPKVAFRETIGKEAKYVVINNYVHDAPYISAQEKRY